MLQKQKLYQSLVNISFSLFFILICQNVFAGLAPPQPLLEITTYPTPSSNAELHVKKVGNQLYGEQDFCVICDTKDHQCDIKINPTNSTEYKLERAGYPNTILPYTVKWIDAKGTPWAFTPNTTELVQATQGTSLRCTKKEFKGSALYGKSTLKVTIDSTNLQSAYEGTYTGNLTIEVLPP